MTGLGAASLAASGAFISCTAYRSKITHIISLSFDDGFRKSSIRTAEIYEKCDQLGVSRFLLKPVDQDKLYYALISLLAPGGYEPNPDNA